MRAYKRSQHVISGAWSPANQLFSTLLSSDFILFFAPTMESVVLPVGQALITTGQTSDEQHKSESGAGAEAASDGAEDDAEVAAKRVSQEDDDREGSAEAEPREKTSGRSRKRRHSSDDDDRRGDSR